MEAEKKKLLREMDFLRKLLEMDNNEKFLPRALMDTKRALEELEKILGGQE
jgi:hypothetical protein